jgi:hypothetical protein
LNGDGRLDLRIKVTLADLSAEETATLRARPDFKTACDCVSALQLGGAETAGAGDGASTIGDAGGQTDTPASGGNEVELESVGGDVPTCLAGSAHRNICCYGSTCTKVLSRPAPAVG